LDDNRKIIIVLLAVMLVGAATVFSLYVLVGDRSAATTSGESSTNNGLPAGCSKPAGGFLVLASHLGWNDSELKGTGVTPGVVWPMMNVTEGSTVNITVCNIDVQAHSFNIAHYLVSPPNTIHPGQVLHFSFVATTPGTFQVYCEIPCSIHIYMLSGQLKVAPS
jgi:FtsP/CotA-like multicopper oxidase with cupredoxin domain